VQLKRIVQLLRNTGIIPHSVSLSLCPDLIDLGEPCNIRTGLEWYMLVTGTIHRDEYNGIQRYILTEEKAPKRWDAHQSLELIEMSRAPIKKKFNFRPFGEVERRRRRWTI
jgi:hypothetical protein